jgi:single-stranded-DNA-specific exonuclease
MAHQQTFLFRDNDPSEDLTQPAAVSTPPVHQSHLASSQEFHPATPRVIEFSPNAPAWSSIETQREEKFSELIKGIFASRNCDGAHDSPPRNSLLQFDTSVSRIIDAVQRGERIGIVGDYDVDGVTSVSLFVNTLSRTDSTVEYWIPNRFSDGYGISDSIATDVITKGCGLVLLLDHGTHAHKHIDRLRASGIDVIVIDHHNVGVSLPNALVINPRQEGCGFQGEFPSAAGLACIVCREIARRLELPLPNAGLAALSTVADMVPLVGLNRVFGRKGLDDLRHEPCVGIRALSEALGIDYARLSSSDLGFLLGPSINAAGRLEDARVAVELFTCNDPVLAKEYAEQLVALNANRKQMQREALVEILTKLKQCVEPLPPAIISHSDSNHAGVVGLLASGVANRYARPSIVFANAQDGILTGSGRSGHPSIDLHKVFKRCEEKNPSIMLKWGGHKAAGGVSIRATDLTNFEKLFNEALLEIYPTSISAVSVQADVELLLSEITPAFIQQLESKMEPCGQGFPAIQILLKNVHVKAVTEMDGGRARVLIAQGNCSRPAFIGTELWDKNIREGDIISLTASPVQFFNNSEGLVQFSVSAYQVEHSPTGQIEMLHARGERTTDTNLTAKRNSKPMVQSLTEKLHAVQQQFDDRLLYPDLALKVEDPFVEIKPQSFWNEAWNEFKREFDLAFNSNQITYRPAQIEFVRFFFERNENQILQAPTGSGKTEIALMIASHYLKKGGRVVFVAPTIDIVNQTATRALHMLGENSRNFCAKGMSPAKRQLLYQDNTSGFFVGTPHVFVNDLQAGHFSFGKNDLLIIDEAHHTTGNYPSVTLLESAISANTRSLLVSATPVQAAQLSRWSELVKLKSIAGVNYLFPLNVPPHNVKVRSKHLEYTPTIQKASEQLLIQAVRVRQQILNVCNEYGLKETKESIKQIFQPIEKIEAPTIPSSFQIREIRKIAQTFKGGSKYQLISLLRQAEELSGLYHTLTVQGISGFLRKCLEGRMEILFPTQSARGSNPAIRFAPSKYMQALYTSTPVKSAFDIASPAPIIQELWKRSALESIGELPAEFRESSLTSKRRRSLHADFSCRVKAKLIDALVPLDFIDHRKEQYVLSELQWHQKKTFISVSEREHAIFLARRISHRLSNIATSAVCLTGNATKGVLGISTQERVENLRRFNSGEATVLVGTSASNEGVDIEATYGYAYQFDSSATKAKQKEGRVGRRTLGQFEYLCSNLSDYTKLRRAFEKMIHFQEMLNEQRRDIVELLGQKADTGNAIRTQKRLF